MSEISFQSNAIANGMINQIIQNFEEELLTKEVIKKLPEKLEENLRQFTQQIVYSNNIPKPNVRRQPPMIEDIMPGYRAKQSSLISNVPITARQSYRLELESAFHRSSRNSATPRYLSSEELRNNRKSVKINLDNLKANKVIQLRPQQSTAKSYRSVIELQQRITDLRRTFLRSLREKERLNQTTKQSPFTKRKKIPKQFTYDYEFNIMQSSFEGKKGTVRSPLKTKSISTGQITKKMKNPESIIDNQSNLEEELARKSTGMPEKEKRAYNNSSRRQVSHFPYISLVENSVLYQNDNVLHGPGSTNLGKTSQSWKMRRSSFTPFFDKNLGEQATGELITQTEDVVFPATIRKDLNKSLNVNGSILKNPRYFKKNLNSQGKQSRTFVEFKPLNVTRNLAIDQYYKMKAVDQ